MTVILCSVGVQGAVAIQVFSTGSGAQNAAAAILTFCLLLSR